MRAFDDILTLAAVRKGGLDPVEALLPVVKPAHQLANIPDDRWLAGLSKRVFQAGFNWRVVEDKWPGFEAAFEGFDPERWHYMSDADLGRLLKDTRIVRHAKKILAVRDNATLLCELKAEQGSAAKCLAHWPGDDYVGLLEMLKQRGSRLGGATAQYFLRGMGKDAFLLSRDVVTALVREQVVSKPPSGKRDLRTVQEAFNTWAMQSGRPLAHISRILALSVDSPPPVQNYL